MPDVAEVMAKPIAQQLVRDEPVLRMSYTARDGSPRVIPIGYLWDGVSFLLWSLPISAKVAALEADPRVAITIDVIGPPPRVPLARGRAELSIVEGVPDGYLQASHRGMPEQAWAAFDEQVRSLYEQVVAITVTPDWAKLLDFETTLPSAVETLVRRRA
jgi:nitroimidazol reductase NimA-like FMN-containing flavoprotein (pyridoxamine 5'-phosphate oxidase superfamily)